MTERYGPYPIKGEALRETLEGRLVPPGSILGQERWSNEDVGFRYDDVDKVAALFQIWSSTESWPAIADWYARRLEPLDWTPFPGNQYRGPSGWPWNEEAEGYDLVRPGEEFSFAFYPHSYVLDMLVHVPNHLWASRPDATWFSVTMTALSPGRDRYAEIRY
jgi:hypothetical protein